MCVGWQSVLPVVLQNIRSPADTRHEAGGSPMPRHCLAAAFRRGEATTPRSAAIKRVVPMAEAHNSSLSAQCVGPRQPGGAAPCVLAFYLI